MVLPWEPNKRRKIMDTEIYDINGFNMPSKACAYRMKGTRCICSSDSQLVERLVLYPWLVGLMQELL